MVSHLDPHGAVVTSRWTRTDLGLARTGLLIGLAGALLVGGTTAVVLSADGATTAAIVPGPSPQPLPTPEIVLPVGETVPWHEPLAVTASQGTLVSVVATSPAGTVLEGSLTPSQWVSTSALAPATTYSLQITLLDQGGKRTTVERTVTTAKAKTVRPTVAPASGTYGVGQPVIVRFNRPVKSPEARRAVVGRLRVTTSPAVQGAWRWFNSYEVHYRGATYWKPGTTITTTADLRGLRLPGSLLWGSTSVARGTMTIGRSLTAVVDIATKEMTVRRNGKVVRVFDISAGRKDYPTRGGDFIVLKREKVHLFDSSTVGIPTASPDGYYRKLPWSVRITNSGTFVHTNNSTIRYQGSVNVSHGCINARESDAKWFYDNTLLGDVVTVTNARIGPNRTDAGAADWNYTWETWQQGNYGD